jgi:hypothetical protein
VSKGWSKEQAMEAFEAVGCEGDQKEHVDAAVLWALNKWPGGPLDFLLRRRQEEDAKAKQAANKAAKHAPEAPAPAPSCHAVEDLLSRHQEAKELVLTCLRLHDAERGQHSSDLLIATSNIKLAAKRNNKTNAGSPYLEAVCAAIASDCEQCHQLLLRKKTAQQEQDDVAAAKLLSMQVVIQPYPLTAGSYAPVPEDEIVTCDGCGLGWSRDDPAKRNVRLCEGCPAKFHDACMPFVRVSSLSPTATYNHPDNWICTNCVAKHADRQSTADSVNRMRDRDRDRDDRQPPRSGGPPPRRDPPPTGGRASGGGGPAEHSTRPPPQHHPHYDSQQRGEGPPSRQYVNHNTASAYRVNRNYCSDSENELEDGSTDRGTTPPPPKTEKNTEKRGQPEQQKIKASGNFSLETLSEQIGDLLVKKTQPNHGVVHQVEKYTVWEFTHGDKRIADARCGWSKQAWLHHRRINIPLRDQAIDRGYSNGPLKNALSVEMKRSVRTKLSNSAVISGQKSAADVARWFKEHTTWFEDLEDELYIKAMDEKFQVATPAALFRLRIANNIQSQTEDGYPYYPEKEFGLHSDQWINMLAELQELNHDLTEKNLKDAFIETIRPHKLLFNEANRLGTPDVTTLIATLSDWLTREQQKCTDVQNAVDDLEEENPKKKKDDNRRNPPPESTSEPNPKKATPPGPFRGNAQMNQMVKAFFTMYGEANKGQVSGTTTTGPGFLTGPGSNREFQCNQCGNWWDNKRKIPCKPECKYIRHPKFKARGANVPWPKDEPALTYKGVPYHQIDEETKKSWDADKARRAQQYSQGGGGGRPPPTMRGGA